MKKFILSAALIVVFFLYVVHEQNEGDEEVSIPVDTNNSPTPTSTQTLPQKLQYKTGTYTGDRVDAFFGYVQIEVVIDDQGKLSDIHILDYPSDRHTSEQINSQALPRLIQESVQAQNAHIDTITGATQTSEGFRRSLESALEQAS